MAGAIKLLQYQMVAYWRRSFSVRGTYDQFSIFIILLLLSSAYGSIWLLNQTAKSLSNGNTEDLKWLMATVFFVWFLPAFEGQGVTKKLEDFIYLPLTKTQFALIGLANVLVVPTSIIALLVSFAAIYPLLFSNHNLIGIFALFIYSSLAVFTLTLLVRLLRLRVFRICIFLLSVIWAFLFFGWKTDFNFISGFLPHNLFAQIISSDHPFPKILFLAIFAAAAFFLAFFTLRLTILESTRSNRRIAPRWLSNISLPIKFGELIKKDFFSCWKILDCYVSLFVTIIYAIILATGDIAFSSFSVVISLSIMLSGSLAFSVFGLETTASFERLSLAPIRPADLFIAKNRAFAFLTFSQTFFLFPLILFQFGIVYLMVAILKTISVCFLYMAWGNSLSVSFPFKMKAYEISFGGSIQDIVRAIFLISLFSILPDFLLSGNALAILLNNIIFAIFSCLIYKFSLRRVSIRLSGEWENIAVKLS